jgi:hypothetical protein
MQFPVDLGEGHGTAVASKDRERRSAQLPAPQRPRPARNGRDRRRTPSMRHTVAVHDVFLVHPRPHHDAHLRELRAHLAELLGEHALRGIELGRPIEQRCAFSVKRGELARSVRDASIARRILDARHGSFPLDLIVVGGSGSQRRYRRGVTRRRTRSPRVNPPCPPLVNPPVLTILNRPVLTILAKNRRD